MARCGFGEAEIMLQGRWKSQAWRSYALEGRRVRLSEQIDIFKRIGRAAAEEAGTRVGNVWNAEPFPWE